MRYLVTISYDGKYFHGFQRQNDVITIQKVIEQALSNILNEEIVIKGSGRTDAFVHAYNQAFHFDTLKPVLGLKHKLNKTLNHIKVKKIKRVENTFHARHSVKQKHYVYKIHLGYYNPKYDGYFLQMKNINLKKIKDIKDLFIGTYDFHNFVAGKRENYETTIYKIKVKKKFNIVEIHFYGKAFYRYMVRKLVGAFLDYSKGRVSKEILEKMLLDKNFNKELSTVKAEGLYLVKIYY